VLRPPSTPLRRQGPFDSGELRPLSLPLSFQSELLATAKSVRWCNRCRPGFVRSGASGTLFLERRRRPARRRRSSCFCACLQEAEGATRGAAFGPSMGVRVLAGDERTGRLAEEATLRSDYPRGLSGVAGAAALARAARGPGLAHPRLALRASWETRPIRSRAPAEAARGANVPASLAAQRARVGERLQRPWCSLGASRSDCVTFQRNESFPSARQTTGPAATSRPRPPWRHARGQVQHFIDDSAGHVARVLVAYARRCSSAAAGG